jgi:Family of unknown function (DUF5317)
MILPFAVLLTMISVPLAGGQMSRLADIKLRALWAAGLALAIQILIVNVFAAALPHAVASALHMASYILAAWVVVANRRIRGLWIVAVGGGLNMLAIAANNGVMPASPAAVVRAGLVESVGEFANSAATTNPRLGFLGDVFAIPRGIPLANVFSVGDVLLVVGLAVVLHSASGSSFRRGRTPSPAA